tara:strand:+ start:194 stop:358 length:165 start_codon:yes stop_codon:yes gene_type:complete
MNIKYDNVQQVVSEIGCIIQNIKYDKTYSIIDTEYELQEIINGYNKAIKKEKNK